MDLINAIREAQLDAWKRKGVRPTHLAVNFFTFDELRRAVSKDDVLRSEMWHEDKVMGMYIVIFPNDRDDVVRFQLLTGGL